MKFLPLNAFDNLCLCVLELLSIDWNILVHLLLRLFSFHHVLPFWTGSVFLLESKANSNCSLSPMPAGEVLQAIRERETSLSVGSHDWNLLYFGVIWRNAHGFCTIKWALVFQWFPEKLWAIPPVPVFNYVLCILTTRGIIHWILICFLKLPLIG